MQNGGGGIIKGENTVVACISLEDLSIFEGGKTIAKPSRFPKTTLDFTITYDGVYGDLEMMLSKFRHNLVTGFRLKDIYGKKWTLEFSVVSYEKSLTSEEIQGVYGAILGFIKTKGLQVDE